MSLVSIDLSMEPPLSSRAEVARELFIVIYIDLWAWCLVSLWESFFDIISFVYLWLAESMSTGLPLRSTFEYIPRAFYFYSAKAFFFLFFSLSAFSTWVGSIESLIKDLVAEESKPLLLLVSLTAGTIGFWVFLSSQFDLVTIFDFISCQKLKLSVTLWRGLM